MLDIRAMDSVEKFCFSLANLFDSDIFFVEEWEKNENET